MNWYNYSWMEVVKILASDEKNGLKSDKVREFKEKYGENCTPHTAYIKASKLILKLIKQAWVAILLANFMLLELTGGYITGFLTLTLIIISAFLYFSEEYKNNKRFKYLDKLDSSEAAVLRDGKISHIPGNEIVPGDIVYLEKGRIVSADLRVIESDGLKLRQAAITGESYDVHKYETKIEERDIALSEMNNIAFKSSLVVEGAGIGIVIATGAGTELSSITGALAQGRDRISVIRSKVIKIFYIMCCFSFIIGVALSIYRYTQNYNMYVIIRYLSYGFLSFIPIFGFIAIYFYMFLIKFLFSRRGIKIKSLFSVEAACKVDHILVNKSGIISENKKKVYKYFTDDNIYFATEKNKEYNKNFERLLNICVLDNDGMTFNEESEILKFIQENYADTDLVRSSSRRIFQIPYDENRRMKTTVNKVGRRYRASVKGSVDKIIERTTHIMKNGVEVEITKEDINKIKEVDLEMSNEYLDVMAFAYRNFSYEPSIDENIESYLVFVGLIAFKDPIREESAEVLEQIEQYGIKPIIFTDDSKLTAMSMCREIGFKNYNDIVLCGIEMDNIGESLPDNLLENINVYSRIDAKDKVKIIKNMNGLNYRLCSVGTKLTDLPCLENSLLSITYDEKSSNLLKNLSDAHFNEISLKSLFTFIIECRKTYNCLIQIIKYMLISVFSQGLFVNFYISMRHSVFLNLDILICINLLFTFIYSIFLFIYFKNKVGNNMSFSKKEQIINIGLFLKYFVYSLFIALISISIYSIYALFSVSASQFISMAILPIVTAIFTFTIFKRM